LIDRPQGEKRRAIQAMVSCPYGAIRLRKPDPLVKAVVEQDFPIPVDPEALPGVYHLGYHHRESMGATPYLIVRAEGKGNVMVDAPRFTGRLAKQVEALGGVAYHVITHEGAAPDHDYWHAFFPQSERVVHRMDVTRQMRDEVEAALNGKGPWTIDDDIKLVALPGYTPGSIGLIYRPSDGQAQAQAGEAAAVLFSGRTVGWSPRLNQLDGFAQFSRGHLQKQAESIRALAEEEWGFEWILPAEGTRYRFPSPQARVSSLREAADRFVERGRVGSLSM
jgi:glyoxylase-like metal-dependent hydrolase (beta-lactamase superfamily II)